VIDPFGPFRGSQESLEITDARVGESKGIHSISRAQALEVRCAARSRQVVEDNNLVSLLEQPGGQI
jgi:hypothetical protein